MRGLDDSRAGRISAVSAIRADLIQISIVAVILAVGAGIIATGISLLVAPSPTVTLIVGGLVIGLGLMAAFVKLMPQIKGTLDVEGAIFLDSTTREPIKVDRYELATDFSQSIQALGAENKALARAWKENPFYKHEELSLGRHAVEKTISYKLGVEALEYYVLHRLSIHLTDYFNENKEADESELHEFTRSDFPAVLLENRCIDLFCRPLEEREAFGSKFASGAGKIVYAVTAGGALYDNFDLTLPRHAKVVRLGHGSIQIITKRFSLMINCSIGGNTNPADFRFPDLYIGKQWKSLEIVSCTISLRVRFRLRNLFSRTGWQYYEWIDGFLDKIDERVSVSRFMEKIGWDTALTSELIRQKREGSDRSGNVGGAGRQPARLGKPHSSRASRKKD